MLYIGSMAESDERGTVVKAEFVNWGTQIIAHAMVSIIDHVGIITCIIILKGRLVHRNLCVHGKITAGIENPNYLMGVTLVHAVRSLRDWIIDNPAGSYEVDNAVIQPGKQQLRADISRRFTIGILE